MANIPDGDEDLRDIIRSKAARHRQFYESLVGTDIAPGEASTDNREMAQSVCENAELCDVNKRGSPSPEPTEEDDAGSEAGGKRQRRQGVYELSGVVDDDATIFKSVKQLRENYLAMLEKTSRNLALAAKESAEKDKFDLLVPPPSGYCSSSASGGSDDEREKSWPQKNAVRRCGSSDSAVHSDEDAPVVSSWVEKREEYNVGEGYTAKSPYSPRGSIDHSNVPSRTIIEAQYVPLPLDRKFSVDCVSDEPLEGDASDCRRQSCFSEGDAPPRYRYWRTPSVVVSDYSDDIMGLTLEDIEYIRNKKENSSSPDSSLHSSCSNLNYCGSSISALEGDYVLSKPYRKSSNCSTCSTLSDEEGEATLHPNRNKELHVVCLTENRLNPHRSPSRSPSPASDTSPRPSRRSSAIRRSASPSSPTAGSRRGSTTGYEQYQKSLLEVPFCPDYGDPSSDDLSSEWDSDVSDTRRERTKPSGWRKLRNIVQWTPFFQTYKKQRYPWVQLAGHQGNFKAGPDQGTILKKLCAKEEKCFKILMKDVLRPYVPEYKGIITSDDKECSYIQLQDLLGDFVSPCVMDCKIGVRTYLEEELAKAKEKPKLRKDMYEKMCQIDQNAPTDEEHKMKGVTKPRYMVWRETISSTATLGFRIEGIRSADGTSSKDFKTTKTKEQIIAAFEKFTDGFPHAIPKYIQRLKAIKATLETSEFFSTHEVIGSSLLFVHDRYNANVWLIDFAKTIVLPEDITITHSSKWKVGNHEDGYLIGVNNLIKIFMTMLEHQPVAISPPLSLQDPPEVSAKEKDENT